MAICIAVRHGVGTELNRERAAAKIAALFLLECCTRRPGRMPAPETCGTLAACT